MSRMKEHAMDLAEAGDKDAAYVLGWVPNSGDIDPQSEPSNDACDFYFIPNPSRRKEEYQMHYFISGHIFAGPDGDYHSLAIVSKLPPAELMLRALDRGFDVQLMGWDRTTREPGYWMDGKPAPMPDWATGDTPGDGDPPDHTHG